jgi:hypothetical protein
MRFRPITTQPITFCPMNSQWGGGGGSIEEVQNDSITYVTEIVARAPISVT